MVFNHLTFLGEWKCGAGLGRNSQKSLPSIIGEKLWYFLLHRPLTNSFEVFQAMGGCSVATTRRKRRRVPERETEIHRGKIPQTISLSRRMVSSYFVDYDVRFFHASDDAGVHLMIRMESVPKEAPAQRHWKFSGYDLLISRGNGW